MSVSNDTFNSRLVRLVLAAVLLLNTAAIGAMELQSSLSSQLGGDSMPCHGNVMPDGEHDDHALGCDSLCAQCSGAIPGFCVPPAEQLSSAMRFPLTGTDPVLRYGSPLYRPPRA